MTSETISDKELYAILQLRILLRVSLSVEMMGRKIEIDDDTFSKHNMWGQTQPPIVDMRV